MKSLILTGLLLISSTTQAGELLYSSTLERFDVADGVLAPNQYVASGAVLVNKTTNKVTLSLNIGMMHWDDSIHPIDLVEQRVIELPIVTMDIDMCGIETIRAFRDDSACDGATQFLTVINNSNNECMSIPESMPTEVIYEVSTRLLHGAISNFGGTPLIRDPIDYRAAN